MSAITVTSSPWNESFDGRLRDSRSWSVAPSVSNNWQRSAKEAT